MTSLITSSARKASTAPAFKSNGGDSGSERPATQAKLQQRQSRLLAGVPGCEASRRAQARTGCRSALRKLTIPESASMGGGALTTPFGTRWTVVGRDPLTPATAVGAQLSVMLSIGGIEVQQPAWRQANVGDLGIITPSATGRARWVAPIRLADRHHHPIPGPRKPSSFSQTNTGFQKFRQDLWRHGPRFFGNPLDADVFVRAFHLPCASSAEGRHSSDKGENSVSALSVLAPGRLTVRAVIHSKQRAAVVLTRQFELRKLHDTIPGEPSPSPCSPNFDREAMFSALRTAERPATMDGPYLQNPGEELSSGHDKLLDTAIPMHVPYARAHLPALAAIMMTDRVSRGDVVDLAVPHPEGWLETVAYVYTGECELLTEPVRENILNLGGRV